ncbi:MAG: hypothetical protein A3A43_03415 [Candidatus Liptonbacteria bacterium RIFCSPLOWO2_01_FULL_56_20]|uniref:GTP pyrophosphokinase n=1 Tax=Candidatus Liptonbacteria bacterium RIFCSPLOWO2_01_FULL_56_20 TaxID=1798652 RepID=A0A1G2CLC1_9BACT|nr:MAG: RelA/SpoT family protein [Parcubacteria group bacterium GW2011_GWB1_56_8]OGY97643.1 MAG: hypothetical protein A2681_02935 [Candidatus Liptonbacteria bacterium RIFCSPHIGHO2_01_FULL_56_18b]OGZ01461.1 MAG: hypothetical protein A3A43_03415 [Candidatus Liptonbacteria bacterium RIFCSPLOWO2_01_FULL_56_20]
MSVKDIIQKDPDGLVARAFRFAERAHSGQRRKTSEPYMNHLTATAEKLSEWRLDDTSVAAGLLHDVLEDTSVHIDELRRSFGDEVTLLVDGVTKLGKVKYRGAKAKVENLRKMIFALSQDLRVIFIKLADRLHNMRTLGVLPPQKQKRIAEETAEVYAPIASRLGMYELAGELQDLAFPYLHPKESRWLKTQIAEEYGVRRAYLEKIWPALEQMLHGATIVPAAVDFRAKRAYSLYRKLLRFDMDINKIYDLVALRVIVDTTQDCYAALGTIHGHWPPLPGRIKDYIAMPKANNYRSLHTTVIGPEGRYVEIQLRTKEMHEENEYGIAAHWLYKAATDGQTTQPRWDQQFKNTLQWVQQLKQWQEQYRDAEINPEDFLSAMKVEFFRDRTFAITPQGDVIDLPQGSTPVDFAYHIHTDIGNACAGATVNGQFVPLNHELRSGDMVEILTQKNKKPSEDWLSFVKTALAREHIKSALRERTRTSTLRIHPSKAELKIVAQNRIGLLKDVSATITQSHVNILDAHTGSQPSGNSSMIKIHCETADRKKIEKLVLKLKKIRGVKQISYQLL